MVGFLKKLMPREDKFFDLFEAHAAKSLEAAVFQGCKTKTDPTWADGVIFKLQRLSAPCCSIQIMSIKNSRFQAGPFSPVM